MSRESVVVIAPGRGTYNATELGYLQRWHSDKTDLINAIDAWRGEHKLASLGELDAAERYSLAKHGKGTNAAALIYASAMGDFLDIDRQRFDVVAVTGNSMGWYLALAAAGCTQMQSSGIELVRFMAHSMDQLGQGGQLVYPLVDEDWQPAAELLQSVERALLAADGDLQVSIRLGGMIVLAGTDAALDAAVESLPGIRRSGSNYPMRLANHAAFHTSLLENVSALAFEHLPDELFSSPKLPLIDGRGEIWQPWCDTHALRDYTLGAQVTQTYDFSRAVDVALKEFAPDRLIVLGPGSSMGAPVLQRLLAGKWQGISGKAGWLARQAEQPFVLAMGIEAQRSIAVGSDTA